MQGNVQNYVTVLLVSSYSCNLILQVIAFCEEEGVRFQTTFLGSGAIAGILPATTLEISDKRYQLKKFLVMAIVKFHISNIFIYRPLSGM